MGRRSPTPWVKGRICVSYLEDMEVILDDHVISLIDKLNSVCAEVSLSLPIPSDKPTHNFVPGQQLPIQSLNIGPGQNLAQLITSRSPLKVPCFTFGSKLSNTSVIYSGAKKYLVSHQLCKFSHLKR